MKELIQIVILMCIVSIMTSCTSSKPYNVKCRGLKAHPHYDKNWK